MPEHRQAVQTLDFELGRPLRGPLGRVRLVAVLYPIFGFIRGDAVILEYSADLHRRWRMRLHELAEAGWSPGARPQAAYARMRNCAPAFTAFTPQAAGCHRATACPFCWSRAASGLWRRLDNALNGPDRPRARTPLYEYDLVVRTGIYTLRDADADQAAAWVRGRVRGRSIMDLPPFDARFHRLAGLRAAGALGVLDVTRLLPPTRPHDDWAVRRAQLIVAPPEAAAALAEGPARALREGGERLRHRARPSRRRFADAVARPALHPAPAREAPR